MIRAILLCLMFVCVARAEGPNELFDFGCPVEEVAMTEHSVFAIKFEDVPEINFGDSPIIIEEAAPIRRPFFRFRDFSNLSVEELARRPFLERLRSRFSFARLGRIRAWSNFAATGVNTRLQNLSLFFPRAIFNLR